jgi:hypothetical protein
MSTDRGCQCGQAHCACATEFQYAVKFLCGVVSPDTRGQPAPLAPGQYWTAINIHNPEKCRGARFRWKAVVAAPLGQEPAIPVMQRQQVLGPDLALEIDCHQISHAVPRAPFLKGYVVIESDVELDVVAVYTTGHGRPAVLSSFHTERVQPRRVPVCEDLILPFHTGIAAWQTVAPTTGPLGPVVAIKPAPAWAPPPAGSVWVSQSVADGVNASAGTRYYELCFDLCAGFKYEISFDAFEVQMLADDRALATFNGIVLGIVRAPGYAAPTSTLFGTILLRAGRNCLRIEVTNDPSPDPNPTGFAMAGILRVVRGKCPCGILPLVPPGPNPDEVPPDQAGDHATAG